MEFLCQRDTLVQGIATVERAVSARDTNPLLAGILVEARAEQLRLVATDLELGIECFVPAQVRAPGSVVLEGKVISQVVRKLGGQEVLYHTGEAGMATVEGGRARFSLHTLPVDEFPTLPQVNAGALWRMHQGELKRMVRHTIFAAATEDSRPFLTGVFVEVDAGEVRLVATDTSRLAYRRGALLEDAGAPGSAIVPARTLQELMRILGTDDESEVEFSIAENQAVFRIAGVTVISRLIEGQFPDYRRAFPQAQPTRLTLNRTEFLAAVERAALIARRSIPAVITLKATAEHLAVSSREAEVGQVYEEVAVTLAGSEGEASYQAHFLMDVLRAIDTDQIAMEVGEGLKQGSIRPVGDDAYLYVLMPVRVG